MYASGLQDAPHDLMVDRVKGLSEVHEGGMEVQVNAFIHSFILAFVVGGLGFLVLPAGGMLFGVSGLLLLLLRDPLLNMLGSFMFSCCAYS